MTLENLGEVSVPRNSLIADLVLRTGLIDKLGTGIKRMKAMMKDHGLEEPQWEPGTQQGYHVWTIGWYMNALLSRVDPKGRRLGEFIREKINEEVDAEFYIGIDDDFDMERIATLIPLSKVKGILSIELKSSVVRSARLSRLVTPRSD